jgi:hypothetical protein
MSSKLKCMSPLVATRYAVQCDEKTGRFGCYAKMGRSAGVDRAKHRWALLSGPQVRAVSALN